MKELSPVSIDGYNNFKNKGKIIHTRHNTRWSIYEEFLKDFCNQFEFFEDLQRQFDIISQFYIEFLSYGYKQAGGNVILTPDHIKDFMCRVAGVNKNSIILDTCTGTGGFLIKSMQIMFDELEQKKQFTNENKEKVKNNLIGVENVQSMFCSAFVNMMLNGDGKTNLVYGDCLTDIDGEFEKMIRNRKPDIGIINPPYNDNQAIVHIKRLLDLLGNRAVGCIIAPANTLLKNPQQAKELLQKHSLRKYILMPANLFVEQAGAQQTAIFLFEAHTPQREDDLVYFYNLSDDGYKYSSRKTYDLQGVAEDVYKQAIYNVKNEIIISKPTGNDRESYKEKLDLETMKNAIFTTKIQNELKMSDFAKTIIDYYIYEIEEQKRKLLLNKPVDISNWKEFNFFDIFDKNYQIGDSKKITTLEGDIALVSAGESNNGIDSFVKYNENNKLFNENQITLAKNGSVGTMNYQNQKFYATSDIMVLKLKDYELNKYIALFIKVFCEREFKLNYSWSNKITLKVLEKTKIKLPITQNGEIDWQFMEDFMKNVEKEAIIN